MIGTDYPFPWTSTEVDLVLNTPGLSDDERIAILGGTAARLLGFAGPIRCHERGQCFIRCEQKRTVAAASSRVPSVCRHQIRWPIAGAENPMPSAAAPPVASDALRKSRRLNPGRLRLAVPLVESLASRMDAPLPEEI